MKVAAKQVKEKAVVEKIADAVLYEGYILYPYRPSAVKNQQRWNFGVLCPDSYARAQRGTESSMMRTECLVEVNSSTRLDVKVRFLHLLLREVGEVFSDCRLSIGECGHQETSSYHFKPVQAFQVNGQILQTWQEAVERDVLVTNIEPDEIVNSSRRFSFHFPDSRVTELIETEAPETTPIAAIVRTQEALSGEVEISAAKISDSSEDDETLCLRLSIVIRNLTQLDDAETKSRDEALLRSFVSTHTILQTTEGGFISLLDPPENYKLAAAECTNTGAFPVLVGNEGEMGQMLSSPIILYDYPQIAPNSPGELFDGTEIDEILTLRIMTLTDQEKNEMRNADELARKLLERTEALPDEQLLKLHGVMKRGGSEF